MKICLVNSRDLPQVLELFFGWLLLVTLAFVFGTLVAAFDTHEKNCFYLLSWLLLRYACVL